MAKGSSGKLRYQARSVTAIEVKVTRLMIRSWRGFGAVPNLVIIAASFIRIDIVGQTCL